jgi:hypothetical protein
MSSGTLDVEVLLRADRAEVPGTDVATFDDPIDVAPLTCEMSTVADPVLVATT